MDAKTRRHIARASATTLDARLDMYSFVQGHASDMARVAERAISAATKKHNESMGKIVANWQRNLDREAAKLAKKLWPEFEREYAGDESFEKFGDVEGLATYLKNDALYQARGLERYGLKRH